MITRQKAVFSGWTALFPKRRRAKIIFTLFISSTILFFLKYAYENHGDRRRDFLEDSHPVNGIDTDTRTGPPYKDIFVYEDALPQHNKSLPYPEGEYGSYFYPANHIWGLGLNNVLQELILLAYLAYASNRALVFDPYSWHWDDTQDFSEDKGHYSDGEGDIVPSRIPLNAILSGPIAGGAFENVDHEVPRAVNRKYFEEVCPNPKIIDTEEISHEFNLETPVDIMMDRWIERLSKEERCVQMKRGSDQIFNVFVFGHPRLLSIWPKLSNSPILRQWGWSPLVYSAIKENSNLLVPSKTFLHQLKTFFGFFHTDNNDPLSPIPGLLAMHVRRGDFEQHCKFLADWNITYNGFNQFKDLPDRFEVPLGDGDVITDEKYRIYGRHCYPTIEDIVGKVRIVREEGNKANGYPLKRLFIMTNGERYWVEMLKDALRAMGDWELIVASKDLSLTWDQKYIAQVIDMAIGLRAEYFIGNGFSSMTSNLVALRMAREMPPYSTRFW